MTTHKITPDPKCGECHGDGEVFDIVPYGSTVAHLPSFCDCVTDQVDYFHSDTDEIEIVPMTTHFDPIRNHQYMCDKAERMNREDLGYWLEKLTPQTLARLELHLRRQGLDDRADAVEEAGLINCGDDYYYI